MIVAARALDQQSQVQVNILTSPFTSFASSQPFIIFCLFPSVGNYKKTFLVYGAVMRFQKNTVNVT